jgi:hypothetical protein
MYDTEDRERVWNYFWGVDMSLVGLERSAGILNTFLYGFNPVDLQKR